MLKNYGKILLVLLSMLSSLAYSQNMYSPKAEPEIAPSKTALLSMLPVFLKQGHIVGQLGGFWSIQGKTQHVDINSLIGDNFTISSKHPNNVLLGIGYLINGKDRSSFNGDSKLSYGLNFFYLPKTGVSGTVVQENLFSNLSYGYNISHYPLYAVAKSTINLNAQPIALTIDAGIGPNFMRLSQFHETSLDGITIPEAIFSSRTNTVFSATAGLGIKFNHLFGERPLECGYRFFYLGQGSFNIINNQVTTALNTGNVYANALVCSVTL